MKLPAFVLDLTAAPSIDDSVILASHKKWITKRCTRSVTYISNGKPGTKKIAIEYEVSGMHLKGMSSDEVTHCQTLNAISYAEMGVPEDAVVSLDECRCGVIKGS